MRLLPRSATLTAKLILITRGVRSVADGCISVLLPAYLLALGFDALQVGVLTTATLLGSALLTLAVGFYGTQAGVRTLLLNMESAPFRSTTSNWFSSRTNS